MSKAFEESARDRGHQDAIEGKPNAGTGLSGFFTLADDPDYWPVYKQEYAETKKQMEDDARREKYGL